MTPTVSRFLFASTVALALVSVPNTAFAKHHGGGSRGGGGSHGGSHSHGGGGGGFHFGGGGHSSGKSFRSGRSAAPRQTGGGTSGRFGGLPARATSNSSFFGGRTAGSNATHNINAAAGRTIGSSFFRASAAGTRAPVMNPAMNFGSNRPPSVASPARSWSGQGQSSWANTTRSPSLNSNRPPSAASPARSWSGQGQSSWANTPRSPSSFNANRPPSAPSPARSWPGQGQSSWANTPRSPSSFNPNRPPSATSPSRSRSAQNQPSWASLSRSTISFNPNRGLSNSGNSRFGNSASGRSSRSHSRGGSRYEGANRSDWGGNSFNQAASFGGADFSFIPDLFGLALNLGGFGLRGLTLLGPGLSLGVTGLELLASELNNFNPDPSLESRQWGPGPILDPNGNCNCTQ